MMKGKFPKKQSCAHVQSGQTKFTIAISWIDAAIVHHREWSDKADKPFKGDGFFSAIGRDQVQRIAYCKSKIGLITDEIGISAQKSRGCLIYIALGLQILPKGMR